jgi:hypothetical protein
LPYVPIPLREHRFRFDFVKAVASHPMRHACRIACLALRQRAAEVRTFRKIAARRGGYESRMARRAYDPSKPVRGVARFTTLAFGSQMKPKADVLRRLYPSFQ